VRDEDVRSSCFASLDVLCAKFGEDVPYRDGLDAGGIYRAGAQRALRAACELRAPLVYFIGTRPGWYKPFYPCFVVEDDPLLRRVLVTKGEMAGPFDEREPVLAEDPIERCYATREMRVRVHQARFRGRVLPAYRSQCTICRLKEVRLLDAAHIVADTAEGGEAVVRNGVSLCAIHHRAFDQDLVGIDADYTVRIAPRLLEEDDGPMLELLKGFQAQTIQLPQRKAWPPDRDRLALRFERFLERSSA